MSIQLDIVPTVAEVAFWGDIKNQLQSLISPLEFGFMGETPTLKYLGSDIIVKENDRLLLNKTYYLSLEIPNTLSITVMPNKGNLEELEYLEDYARNCEFQFIQSLAESWQKTGFYYEITTQGGRSKNEPTIFQFLAAAIAYISSGYVILMNNNIFDLDVGVYKPDDFKNAQPKF
jgi:hypothetical protein